MVDVLTVKELKILTGWLIEKLEAEGFIGIESSEWQGMYVSVPDDSLFSANLEGIELSYGNVVDDIEFLKHDLKVGKLSDIYTCVHLVDLLRIIVLRKNWVTSESELGQDASQPE